MYSEFREWQYGKSRADEFLNHIYIALLVGRGERYGFAAFARATRAADTVYIILVIVRQVKVYHELNVLHVNAARSDVGCDKYARYAGFKICQRFGALRE